MSQGAELFADQLKKQGFEPLVESTWVEFNYSVEGGTFDGKLIRMAINVPPGFPTTSPGGIEFSPRLRPLNTSALHPQRSHPSNRFKNDGEYWSRPFKTWNKEKNKNAAAYMAYVRKLWMTT
ncbi:MAG: hypothetical protein HOD92_18490 [Deltaproteobacteria bacterium]|jgi:hypothetical protein|nr:hypothetical protein [Deltaproteobacteria bacterium]MBT4639541.1 hypothetical protein [Deltaproteobacteria bacterium]